MTETDPAGRKPNRLIHEMSPYLIQHAHNPVDWYPWGPEALERAKAEDKPILLSIGYAACHWCHVMERESFEDETVAAYMNEHFVCIKVDRDGKILDAYLHLRDCLGAKPSYRGIGMPFDTATRAIPENVGPCESSGRVGVFPRR